MSEEWRSVPGHESYAVSTGGRVRNSAGRVLKSWPTSGGYRLIRLYRDGVGTAFLVHRLVLTVFRGDPPSGKPQCAHGNGDIADNRLSNLRWASGSENNADKHAHGTAQIGEASPRAVLSADEVRDIRARVARGERQQSIADDYGICQTAVSRIKLRKCWRHI